MFHFSVNIFDALPPKDFLKCRDVSQTYRRFTCQDIMENEQLRKERKLWENTYWNASKFSI
jgi:hypothetical protein